ncbi:MAG: hypothetical protein JXB35_11840 [Anaerolineae bacterium]|nr:hypothetical protein [Anaerolineae bacterium]
MSARWSVVRPSLEYQYAFDACAAGVFHVGGAVAMIASRALFARELLKRCAPYDPFLIPEGQWTKAVALPDLLGPEAPLPVARTCDDLPTDIRCLIWAEPGENSDFQALGKLLGVNVHLFIVTSNRLARALPEWQGIPHTSAHPRHILRRARQAGWRVTGHQGYHGLASIVWGRLSPLLERLKRPDLADRGLAQMRMHYAVQGGAAFGAPVQLWHMRSAAP